jgi:hypothetical protein
MTFDEAKMHVRKEAETQGRVIYLYEDWRGYFLSGTYWADWIYQADPAGSSVERTDQEKGQ